MNNHTDKFSKNEHPVKTGAFHNPIMNDCLRRHFSLIIVTAKKIYYISKE